MKPAVATILVHHDTTTLCEPFRSLLVPPVAETVAETAPIVGDGTAPLPPFCANAAADSSANPTEGGS